MILQGGHFVPLFPNDGIVTYGHKCSSQILKVFKLVDGFGNYIEYNKISKKYVIL